jgi:hypothetical protein
MVHVASLPSRAHDSEADAFSLARAATGAVRCPVALARGLRFGRAAPWYPSHSSSTIRADACAVEAAPSDAAAPRLGSTDADADALADWQLGHADPHVRARGELSNLQRVRDPAARAR